MTPAQRSILQHALGVREGSTPRAHKIGEWPWRNHYASAPDCDCWEDICALVEAGMMVRGAQQEGGLICFHATPAGIEYVRAGVAETTGQGAA